MSELSPGPWQYDEKNGYIFDGKGRPMFFVPKPVQYGYINEADIEAAVALPELVAALKAVPRLYTYWGGRGQIECHYCHTGGPVLPVVDGTNDDPIRSYDALPHNPWCAWQIVQEALRKAGVAA